MNNIKRCLNEIEKVKKVAAGEDAAYVARSRLGRLILNVTNIIACKNGMPLYERPGRVEVPRKSTFGIRKLAKACNNLNDTAKTITQPSEPLDDRWKTGWCMLLNELHELEKCLGHIETDG